MLGSVEKLPSRRAPTPAPPPRDGGRVGRRDAHSASSSEPTSCPTRPGPNRRWSGRAAEPAESGRIASPRLCAPRHHSWGRGRGWGPANTRRVAQGSAAPLCSAASSPSADGQPGQSQAGPASGRATHVQCHVSTHRPVNAGGTYGTSAEHHNACPPSGSQLRPNTTRSPHRPASGDRSGHENVAVVGRAAASQRRPASVDASATTSVDPVQPRSNASAPHDNTRCFIARSMRTA